jgi:ubiquinone/menaquinone biosynthesis C-methylase UbiE
MSSTEVSNGVSQNGHSNGHSVDQDQTALSKVFNSQKKGMDFNETMDCYKEWVATYDQEVVSLNYPGPRLVKEFLAKYGKERGINGKSAILDVGAGTGLVAEELYKAGYKNMDAVDAAECMLEIARDKGIYQRLYCAMLGEDRKLPMLDNSYDAAVMSGIFVQGHVKLESLLDIIRLVRPGGLIINAMRESNSRLVEEYLNINEVFNSWCKQGLWKRLEHSVPDMKWYADFVPLVHVYEVTKTPKQ